MLLLLLQWFAIIISAALLYCDPPLSSTTVYKAQIQNFSCSCTSAEHGQRTPCLGLTGCTAVCLSLCGSALAQCPAVSGECAVPPHPGKAKAVGSSGRQV